MDNMKNTQTEDSVITFKTNIESEPIEMIKLCANGDIYVKGRLVENDKEVVQGMRDFLKLANSKGK